MCREQTHLLAQKVERNVTPCIWIQRYIDVLQSIYFSSTSTFSRVLRASRKGSGFSVVTNNSKWFARHGSQLSDSKCSDKRQLGQVLRLSQQKMQQTIRYYANERQYFVRTKTRHLLEYIAHKNIWLFESRVYRDASISTVNTLKIHKHATKIYEMQVRIPRTPATATVGWSEWNRCSTNCEQPNEGENIVRCSMYVCMRWVRALTWLASRPIRQEWNVSIYLHDVRNFGLNGE